MMCRQNDRSLTAVFVVLAFAASLLPGSSHAANLFLPYETHETGSCAEAVAIGDLDNDGLNDVVVATPGYGWDPDNDNRIHVFLQQESGELAFSGKYGVAPAYSPFSVDIGDLNNDGKNDVIVALNGNIGVFLQNDMGTLDPVVLYPTRLSSTRVRIGDFNNDGLDDVVSIDWGAQSHDVEVFLQNISGTLNPRVTYIVKHGGYDDLEVGDVNNDGLDDIIVMSGQGYDVDNLGILLQNTSGTMEGPFYYDLLIDENTSGVAVGDVNENGLQDVVVTYSYNIGVFFQNESGTLDPVVSYPSSGQPTPVEIGDVNWDGKNDVLTAGGDVLEVHLQSDGELPTYELYPIPYNSLYKPHSLVIGDLNNDGSNDVALASCGSGLTVLYANTSPAPDIKANGKDGLVTVRESQPVTITVSVEPHASAGMLYDCWIGAKASSSLYWFTPPDVWVRSEVPVSAGSYELFDLPPTPILERTLPRGSYRFFFILDGDPNGKLDDMTGKDFVDVTSTY